MQRREAHRQPCYPRIFDLLRASPNARSTARAKAGSASACRVVRRLIEMTVAAVLRGAAKGRAMARTFSHAPARLTRGALPPRKLHFFVSRRRRRILVVDDNADAANTLSDDASTGRTWTRSPCTRPKNALRQVWRSFQPRARAARYRPAENGRLSGRARNPAPDRSESDDARGDHGLRTARGRGSGDGQWIRLPSGQARDGRGFAADAWRRHWQLNVVPIAAAASAGVAAVACGIFFPA